MTPRCNIEAVTRLDVRGWAVDLDDPTTPLVLELVLEGQVIASGAADQPRPDLGQFNLGSINFGFSLAVPVGLVLDIANAELRVAGGFALPGFAEATRHEGVLEQVAGTLVSGWAWHAWKPNEQVDVIVRLGQRPLKQVHADIPRLDLMAVGIGDGRHGFELELRLLPDWRNIDPAGINCVFAATGEPLFDMRPNAVRAPAPITMPAGRTFFSAKGPTPPPPPARQAAAPAPPPVQAAPTPPRPVPPAPQAPSPAPPPEPQAVAPAQPAPLAPPRAQPRPAAPGRARWNEGKSRRESSLTGPGAPPLIHIERRGGSGLQPAPEKAATEAPPQPEQPAAPPAKPLDPDLVEAMRNALNFNDDDSLF